jgi:predicted ATPase with chaperone activity
LHLLFVEAAKALRVPFQKFSDERRGEPSATIRARVEAARARQSARIANVKDGQGAS